MIQIPSPIYEKASCMKNCYKSSLFDLNDYGSQDDYYVKKKKKCEVEKVQNVAKMERQKILN